MKLSDEDRIAFHSNAAKLLYISTLARPDMWVSAVYFATRVLEPDTDDQIKITRAIRYLISTRDLYMVLSAADGMQVYAFVDASYAIYDDFKSQGGSWVTLGVGPVYANAGKHKLVTKSSTEAELVTLSDAASQIIWTREFLKHQGYEVQAATIFQDNKSTIALAEKGRSTSARTRHINIRFFFIKDRIDMGELKVSYLPTEEMVADILTKPLQGDLFRRLRDKLLGLVPVA